MDWLFGASYKRLLLGLERESSGLSRGQYRFERKLREQQQPHVRSCGHSVTHLPRERGRSTNRKPRPRTRCRRGRVHLNKCCRSERQRKVSRGHRTPEPAAKVRDRAVFAVSLHQAGSATKALADMTTASNEVDLREKAAF